MLRNRSSNTEDLGRLTETTGILAGMLRADLPSSGLDPFAHLIFKKFIAHKSASHFISEDSCSLLNCPSI